MTKWVQFTTVAKSNEILKKLHNSMQDKSYVFFSSEIPNIIAVVVHYDENRKILSGQAFVKTILVGFNDPKNVVI
jgi:hypothetical protein